MTNCPVCKSKVEPTDKFCAECGVQLKDAPTERVWIIAMQERIKEARHNDIIFNVMAVVGILIAVGIPYITRFIRYNNMDMVSWSVTFVGIVLFIGSALGMMNGNSTVKALIEEMEQGPPEETEEEEDKADNPKIEDK
jgi:uncharacterized protein YacL